MNRGHGGVVGGFRVEARNFARGSLDVEVNIFGMEGHSSGFVFGEDVDIVRQCHVYGFPADGEAAVGFFFNLSFGAVKFYASAAYVESDDAVFFSDFGDGQFHFLSGPCHHGGAGVVGKFSLSEWSGEGILRQCGFGTCACVSAGFLDVYILMVGVVVDDILVEYVLVIVDVPYKHAVAGEVGIPAGLLTVFKEEKFVAVGGVDYASLV